MHSTRKPTSNASLSQRGGGPASRRRPEPAALSRLWYRSRRWPLVTGLAAREGSARLLTCTPRQPTARPEAGPRGPGRRRRATDADINQHLAEALGASQPPPLGGHLAETKEYLLGTSHRIGSAAAMVKTARVI
jgi:hypothetical protein